jgi:hypothetical protein
MKSKALSSKEVSYTTIILKFGKMGEKTGWTYIEVPADVAGTLYPGMKKSFRIKGKLDEYKFSGLALIPIGEGNFILPVNAGLRKTLGKREGAMLKVCIKVDPKKPSLSADLLECLEDEQEALANFKALSFSHQNYFSKWIESAKTPATKAERIARTLNAMIRKMNYAEMLREKKKNY